MNAFLSAWIWTCEECSALSLRPSATSAVNHYNASISGPLHVMYIAPLENFNASACLSALTAMNQAHHRFQVFMSCPHILRKPGQWR